MLGKTQYTYILCFMRCIYGKFLTYAKVYTVVYAQYSYTMVMPSFMFSIMNRFRRSVYAYFYAEAYYE